MFTFGLPSLEYLITSRERYETKNEKKYIFLPPLQTTVERIIRKTECRSVCLEAGGSHTWLVLGTALKNVVVQILIIRPGLLAGTVHQLPQL